MNKFTLDEMLFAIGHFPSANTTEKFSLFIDQMNKYFPGILVKEPYATSDKTKKLSPEKKASFMSYLEKLDLQRVIDQYKKKNIRLLHILSPDYPEQLKHIYIPPVVLFYQGDIALLKKYTLLGVVGSRDYTPYGKKVVDVILSDLLKQTNREIGIISGLAKGIDTEAHLTTIKQAGHTIGVVGTGLDVFYPHKNKMLQEIMGRDHLVLSEYPIGSKPLPYHFPERNRIIAGLSRGVLVIESKESSGSLITAYNAIEESRDVFVIPGSIFEEHRLGNHKLIKLGAILVQSSDDILAEWVFI